MYRDPLKTTVKGLNTTANVRVVVQRIQSKIFEYGLCSEKELHYLRTHTNWDELNPPRINNLG